MKALFSSVFLLMAIASHAMVKYVDGSLPSSGTGLSWSDAYNDLQLALNEANPGDEIWVTAGTYVPTSFFDPDNRDASFELPVQLELYGGFVGGETSLSERQPTVNLTILSGEIGGPGFSDNSKRILEASDAADGSVVDGFVIEEARSFLPELVSGGAVNIVPTGPAEITFTLRNCLVRNAWCSENGGGIYAVNTALTLTDCVFEFCEANENGGAVCMEGGSLDALRISVAYSGAELGGGLYLQGGTDARMRNCLVHQCDADIQGGGIYVTGHTVGPNLINVTVANNVCNFAGRAGGLYCFDSNPNIGNCIFYGNTDNEVTFAGSSSPVLLNNIIPGLTLNGNFYQDPVFRNPDLGDFQLAHISPAIDAGNNTLLSTILDLDLAPRVVDGTVDLGALESQEGYALRYFVDAATPTPGDGRSWDLPFNSLEDALSAAPAGAELWVTSGEYTLTGTDRSAQFVSNGVSIFGGFESGMYAASERDPYRATILSGDLGISGEDFDNAYRLLSVHVDFSDVTLNQLVLREAYSELSGPPALAGEGAGLYVSGDGTLTANRVEINTVYTGRYVVLAEDDASLQWNYSRVRECTGIAALTSGTELSAVFGMEGDGALAMQGSVITNCDVGYLGMLYNEDVLLAGNTFAQNRLAFEGFLNTGSTTPHRLVNTVFALNRAPLVDAAYACEVGHCFLDGSIHPSQSVGGVMVDSDPQFLDAWGLDFYPSLGSPLIDAGDNSADQLMFDFEGGSRQENGNVDIGAFEFDGTIDHALYVDLDATGAGDGSSWNDAITSLDALYLWVPSNRFLRTVRTYVAEGEYLVSDVVLRTDVPMYGGFDGQEAGPWERDIVANPCVLTGQLDAGDPPNSRLLRTSGPYGTASISGFELSGADATGALGEVTGAPFYFGQGAVVQDCVVRNNRSDFNLIYDDGFSSGRKSVWVNCLIAGNEVTDGPLIRIFNRSVEFYNCTVAGNDVSEELFHMVLAGDDLFVGNSILEVGDASAAWNGEGGFEALYSNLPLEAGMAQTACINLPSDFVASNSGDYRLNATSPCVDAGADFLAQALPTDLSGNARIQGSLVDLGCYEYEPGSAPCFGDLNPDGFIDTLDLLVLLGQFGCEVGCSADLTGDGAVDTQDILSVLGLFGSACP